MKVEISKNNSLEVICKYASIDQIKINGVIVASKFSMFSSEYEFQIDTDNGEVVVKVRSRVSLMEDTIYTIYINDTAVSKNNKYQYQFDDSIFKYKLGTYANVRKYWEYKTPYNKINYLQYDNFNDTKFELNYKSRWFNDAIEIELADSVTRDKVVHKLVEKLKLNPIVTTQRLYKRIFKYVLILAGIIAFWFLPRFASTDLLAEFLPRKMELAVDLVDLVSKFSTALFRILYAILTAVFIMFAIKDLKRKSIITKYVK